MEFAEYFALRLKEARRSAHISAVDAGKAVHRSDKTIYAWENSVSEPSGEQLLALCRLYHIGFSYFYPPNEVQEDENLLDILAPDEQLLIEAYRGTTDFSRRIILNTALMYQKEMPKGTEGIAFTSDMTDEEIDDALRRYHESQEQ